MGSTNRPRKKSGESYVRANWIVPILQVVTSCGPEKENCIDNQILKDKSCLVPCTGLYADIELETTTNYKLQTLAEEIYSGVRVWNRGSQERFHAVLQQMFPTSADDEVDDAKSLTESYHKYKREYVKHLGFNPDNKNLCK